MMIINCTICRSESNWLMKKDGYDIWQCMNCKLDFVHPQPKAEFLKDEVYSEKSGYQANKTKDLSLIKPTKKQRKILKYLQTKEKGTFFDIGCSSGEIMYLVQKLGYRTIGLELNPRTADIAKKNGLEVQVGTVDDARFPNDFFDYAFMGDLIEHVNDPQDLVGKTGKLLKSNGELMVITPNMDCFWAKSTLLLYKFLKIPWSAATPPHHLFQFSRNNLELLMKQNGFYLNNIWYTGTPPLKYELGSMHLLKRWKNSRKIGDLIFMIMAFAIYSVLFVVNRIFEFFPVKKFSMAAVFIKK